jgi:N-acylneuraminate cytidylyltransferase
MRLAVIPARGGSKRILGKNIKMFAGKPMIAWSIEAALKSQCFDRIIVSTDDDEIAEVAMAHGAEAPFKRPPEISNDVVGTTPVIAHAIKWQMQNGLMVDEVCCIYATAPFIQESDLRSGLEILRNTGAEFAFAVTSYAYPIQRSLRINTSGRVEMLQPELFNTRSQDLEEVWHDAGQFYWGYARAWLAQKPIFNHDAAPIPLPRFRVQDIDTFEDWERAEWMFKALLDLNNHR